MNVRRRRRGPVAEINVTPLTDVFLVLLIIFMVVTPGILASSASSSEEYVALVHAG